MAQPYAAYKKFISNQDTYRPKAKGRKKIPHANGNKEKAEAAILISDKIGSKTKKARKNIT